MSSVKSICNSGIILERGMVSFIGSSKETVSVYLKRADGNMGRLLKDRSDRKGSGKFKFLDIRIKDENNRIVESAISGEAITFEIEYSVAKKLKASELILVVNIQDYNSNNILSFIGDEMESCLNSLEESGTVLLKLKNLSLRSECYKLRLIAFEGNTSMNNCLDYVENAAVLNVLQGDINKIGRMNRKGFSAILPAKFEN